MTNNLDRAVLAITRIGSFSEGEKDALTKAFRTSGFPGNLVITNPVTNQVLTYNGTAWVNSGASAGVSTFTALTDTPPTITANGFVKGNSGATALEYVTNVAETNATETISALWNFTTAPTINSNTILTSASNIDALSNVNTTGAIEGEYLTYYDVTGDWAPSAPYTFNDIPGNPMTTNEDIIKRSAGVATRVPVGAAGQVLTVTTGVVGWADPTGGMTNPMTTNEDIIKRSGGVPARIPVGANGQVLTVTTGVVGWANSAAGFANPMTTAEDIIKGGASGTGARLGVGTNGQVLTVTAGVVGWANSAAGFTNPMTTTGDLITSNPGATPVRLGIGTSGHVLTSNGTTSTWAAPAFVNPLTTQGDILFRNATITTRLPIGATGRYLYSNGTTCSWADPTYLALTDTPSSYTASSWVRANATGTALEWVTAPVTSVGVTAPIGNSGNAQAPVINIAAASGVAAGSMSSAHWTKLEAIESGADVTDSGNVAAAGAVMNGDFSANGYMVRTGVDAYSQRTLSGAAPIGVTNGDGVAGSPLFTFDCTVLTALTVDDPADLLLVYDTSAAANKKIALSAVNSIGGVAGAKFFVQTAAPTGMVDGDIWIDIN